MKSVIIIAYGFPPDGSAGVYRPLRFVRHLSKIGWQPTVVAADKKQYGRYDPGLLSLVPNQVEVVRVSGEDFWQSLQAWRARRDQKKSSGNSQKRIGEIHEAQSSSIRSQLRRFVRKIESWYYHPDMAMPWIKCAVGVTVQLCRRLKPKIILVTGGPWSSFVVARNVFLQTGAPYVLDFRDSWTLAGSPFDDERPKWAKRRDRRLLFQLFKDAQAVIFRYPSEAECYWRAYPGALETSRIHIIPNGFDGIIQEFKPVSGSSTQCVILYAGTITPYRYDTLLQGINFLKNTDPILTEKLQLLFVGEGVDALASLAEKVGVSGIVKTMPPVSYAEVSRLQAEASALLLLGLVPMEGYELCGSKVFSYLQVGRPIIGVVSRDENRNILKRVGVRTIADIDSPREISTVLRQVLDAWQEGTLSSLVPSRKACEAYSAGRQTKALIRALEGRPPVEPFIPGSAGIPPSLQGIIGNNGWLEED
jgi:hypothetical protein